MTFKISQNIYNLRVLNYIKKELGVGSITTSGSMASFRIRDRKVIGKIILPIFDEYPLLTKKYNNYKMFRNAYEILEGEGEMTTKNIRLEALICNAVNTLALGHASLSPVWKDIDLEDIFQIKTIVSKPWLVGFVEAEGSFYLVSKDKDYRIVHGFGISQKEDKIVLEAIRKILHISSKVSLKGMSGQPQNRNVFYLLDTTNSRAIMNISKYFLNTMKGMKAVEYRIWSRSFNKGEFEDAQSKYKRLYKVREILRKLRVH